MNVTYYNCVKSVDLLYSMLDAHLHVQSGCTTDIMVNIIIIQNMEHKNF